MKLKLIAHLIIMVLVLYVVWAIYGMWYTHVTNESTRAAALAGEIQTQSELARRAEYTEGDIAKITGDQTVVNQYFVQNSDIVPFIESLQTAGEGVGSKVTVISVSAKNAPPQNYLDVSLSITGTFDAVERTLGSLEYSAHDITLTKVTLTTTGDGKTASQWKAAASFHVGTRTPSHSSNAPKP